MAISPGSSESNLSQEENARLLGEKHRNTDGVPRLVPQDDHCRSRPPWWKYIHMTAFVTYTAVFLSLFILRPCNSARCSCKENEEGPTTPIMQSAFTYNRRTVDYNFESTTPFKGPPVEQVDAAWNKLLNGPHELRLSAKQIQAANITTIRLADGSGDYIAQPQAYHILHCVFNIYKYAHPEYYGDDPQGPSWVTEHTDHCVDTLRQFVMCHAGGTGVSTYKWLPDHKLPWPVLSADESCIDWDYFDNWVRERSIPVNDIIHQKEKHLLEHPTMGVVSYEDFQPYIS